MSMILERILPRKKFACLCQGQCGGDLPMPLTFAPQRWVSAARLPLLTKSVNARYSQGQQISITHSKR